MLASALSWFVGNCTGCQLLFVTTSRLCYLNKKKNVLCALLYSVNSLCVDNTQSKWEKELDRLYIEDDWERSSGLCLNNFHLQ